MNYQIVRFAIVGVIVTALHYGLYYILQKYINVNIAYTASYVIGFVCSFYMTSYFTFKVKPSFGNFLGFGGTNITNYLMQIALFNLFLYLGITKELAPIPVFAIAIPVNFILLRFVFNSKKLWKKYP